MRHVGRLGPHHQVMEVSSQSLGVWTVCVIFDDEGEVCSRSKGSRHDLEMGELYVEQSPRRPRTLWLHGPSYLSHPLLKTQALAVVGYV